MDRNTLLAIVLAAAVLFAYQTVFVPPKAPPSVNNPQNTAQQHVASNIDNQIAESQKTHELSTNVPDKTSDYDIKSTDKDISFTNVGGSLHKVEFTRNLPFPVTNIISIDELDNWVYSGQRIDEKRIFLTYKNQNWQIAKTYELVDQDLIKVRMEIKNLTEMSNLENLSFRLYTVDVSRMDINQNSRDSALYEYSVSSNRGTVRKGNAIKFSDKNNKSDNAAVLWAGFRSHYQALVIKPGFETKSYEIKADNEKQLSISIKPQDKILGPGESAVYDFNIYLGPQNPWLMKTYHQGFEKIVAFSSFPVIEWIAQAIYYTIPFFHNIFKSWGLGIILISMLIYGITYPLTMQSMMSMRRMQEVQPKLTALKERYKNDPQKLNAEMIEIYRREKINPFGGCLPFLIQMPFFMALYQILWRAQYFQGQGFLWIKDLSQPDRLIIFPFYLPLLGNELNILPVLTGGMMFFQQKISSKNMIVMDEQQATQQRMMMYIMPVMMTFLFYKFASSWAIYFLVFYVLSTLTQWKIAKASSSK